MSFQLLPLDVVFNNIFEFVDANDVLNLFRAYDHLKKGYPRDKIKILHVKFFIELFMKYDNNVILCPDLDSDYSNPIFVKLYLDIDTEFYAYKVKYCQDLARNNGYIFKITDDGFLFLNNEPMSTFFPFLNFIHGCKFLGFTRKNLYIIEQYMEEERKKLYRKYLKIFLEKDPELMVRLLQMLGENKELKSMYQPYSLILTELMVLLM